MYRVNKVLTLLLLAALLVSACQPIVAQPQPMALALPEGGAIAQVNDIAMYYEIHGEGEPLLLMHSVTGSMAQFENVIPILAEEYQVIAVDFRGHGRTTDSGQPLSYELMASDMVALLDQLGLDAVHIVGNKDGGIIGLAMAMAHPDRVKSLVAASANWSPAGFQPWFVDFVRGATLKDWDGMTGEMYRTVAPDPSIMPVMLEKVRNLLLMQPNFTLEQLGAITTPVLVLAGADEDVLEMAHVEEMAEAIPGAELVLIDEAGHGVLDEQFDAWMAAVLEFLVQSADEAVHLLSDLPVLRFELAEHEYLPAALDDQRLTSTPLSTIRAWLDAHNKYRCIHGVPPLQWSERLAKVAEWRAKNCTERCTPEKHCVCKGDSCNPDYAENYSENATCWSATPQSAVDAWYAEEVNYDYSKPEWIKTGHFINVVVSSASKVGCFCSSKHCYCDYDSKFGTTSAELAEVVLKPAKTAAACMPDLVAYSNSQKKWMSGKTQCWQRDGDPVYGKDAGRNCAVYWTLASSSPSVIAHGDWIPFTGVWTYSLGGTIWSAGGSPDPEWMKDCWQLRGFRSWSPLIICADPAMPNIRGLLVGQERACWEQLTASGGGNGLFFCEY